MSHSTSSNRNLNLQADIEAFHERFSLVYEGPPRTLPEDLFQFRSDFMVEELDEYVQAYAEGDLTRMYDALIDLVYVAIGTAYLHGFPFNAGWAAVHACNMQKQRAERPADSKRGTAYDVVKPEGWVGPDETLRDIIDRVARAWGEMA